MPRGRPRKPVELKKLEGTYRADRDREADAVQCAVRKTAVILDRKTVPCPKSISDDYVKRYWRNLTKGLLEIHALSGADIPQLEMMMKILERARILQRRLESGELDEEQEEAAERRYLKAVDAFDRIASKYYVSPAARAKLTLDELNVVKTGQEIQKGAGGVSAVLAMRKAK